MKKSNSIIKGKLEKWYGRIESAQQWFESIFAVCRVLELLEHLSMAANICNTKVKLSSLQALT